MALSQHRGLRPGRAATRVRCSRSRPLRRRGVRAAPRLRDPHARFGQRGRGVQSLSRWRRHRRCASSSRMTSQAASGTPRSRGTSPVTVSPIASRARPGSTMRSRSTARPGRSCRWSGSRAARSTRTWPTWPAGMTWGHCLPRAHLAWLHRSPARRRVRTRRSATRQRHRRSARVAAAGGLRRLLDRGVPRGSTSP